MLPITADYFASRCILCVRQRGQYLFISSRSGCLRLFLVVAYVRSLHSLQARVIMTRASFAMSLSYVSGRGVKIFMPRLVLQS